MPNPLENIISLLAPHRCLSCSREGSLVCENCSWNEFIPPPSRCYGCHKASRQSSVCTQCRRKSALSHVWVATEYEDIAKKLVYKLKFDRASAAADVLARAISRQLPDLPKSVVVTHIPTANKRVRVRGYDQARLIAKALANQRGWQYAEVLERIGSSRQVGSSRKMRLSQLKGAFKVIKPEVLSEAHILLVDDIVTTGATVEAASKVLRVHGAKLIDAAVFSQPIK